MQLRATRRGSTHTWRPVLLSNMQPCTHIWSPARNTGMPQNTWQVQAWSAARHAILTRQLILKSELRAWGWVLSTLVYSLKLVPLPVLVSAWPHPLPIVGRLVILFTMELLEAWESALVWWVIGLLAVLQACHQSHDQYVLFFVMHVSV